MSQALTVLTSILSRALSRALSLTTAISRSGLRTTTSLARRLLLLSVVAALLSACSSQSTRMPGIGQSVPPLPPAPSIQTQWDDYQAMLGAMEYWQVQGKLGVRTPNESGSVTFNWKQLPDQFAIYLNGPLGQGTVWIRGNDDQVSLEQSGKGTLYAPTPELLMYDAMGWWLPVSDLHFWIKGIPAPDKPIIRREHNEDGTLQSLQQNGWQLTYSAYQSLEGWYLPGKVTAQFTSADRRGDLRLTFILRDWQLHARQ